MGGRAAAKRETEREKCEGKGHKMATTQSQIKQKQRIDGKSNMPELAKQLSY